MPRTFNGTTKRLDGGSWFDGLPSMMVVAWYSPSDLSTGADTGIYRDEMVVKGIRSDGGASNLEWSIRQYRTDTVNGPAIQFFVSSGSALQAITASYAGSVSEGDWVCVVGAWDGTSRGVWVSSGVSTTAATTIASMASSGAGTHDFKVGGITNESKGFPGDIGPIAIYESIPSFPTDDYVAQFFHAHPLLVRPDAAACWDIAGESSPEWDKIGGKTLSLTNAPAKATTSPPIILPRTMLSSTFINQYGEIDVRGNGISIVDGSVTTNLADGTDFGDVVV